MARMDAPSKVSMKEIGVSSNWSYQRPEMTEQVQKPKFWGQFGVGGMAQPLNILVPLANGNAEYA